MFICLMGMLATMLNRVWCSMAGHRDPYCTYDDQKLQWFTSR